MWQSRERKSGTIKHSGMSWTTAESWSMRTCTCWLDFNILNKTRTSWLKWEIFRATEHCEYVVFNGPKNFSFLTCVGPIFWLFITLWGLIPYCPGWSSGFGCVFPLCSLSMWSSSLSVLCLRVSEILSYINLLSNSM